MKMALSTFVAVSALLASNIAVGGLVFDAADADNNGAVDASEFAAAMHYKHKLLDKNQDGHLDKSEYSHVIYPVVECK